VPASRLPPGVSELAGLETNGGDTGETDEVDFRCRQVEWSFGTVPESVVPENLNAAKDI